MRTTKNNAGGNSYVDTHVKKIQSQQSNFLPKEATGTGST